MRLLVTGGRGGYLGRHVVRAAREAGHDVVAAGSVDADVRDRAAVDALVGRAAPDAIVHTAYDQSDWDVTATGAAHLSLAAARHGVRMVLVSSDAVFSGRSPAYDESARPDPITAYGAAKAAAETAALAVVDDVVVVRTSLICGDGRSKHEELVHRAVGGADVVLFEDEVRCPVHVDDLASALVELAAGSRRGLLHLGGADDMSRLELGRLVAVHEGLDPSALRAGKRADLEDPGPIRVRLDSSLAGRTLVTRLRGAREFLAP